MKLNFSNLLVLFTVVLTVSTVSNSSAQEGGPNNDFPELSSPFQESNLREDKILLYEPEGERLQREQPVNTQASSPGKLKAKTSEPQKPTPAKTEEDALSFNFLYYIIQKFKTSDIVDK